MKYFIIFAIAVFWSIISVGQVPQGITYQSVVRNPDGTIVSNATLSMKLTIRSGAPDGQVEYVEIHDTQSNTYGLVNLIIGSGIVHEGDFGSINWGGDAMFLETAIDIGNTGNFETMGVTQFLSVPYSMFSGNGVHSMTTEERDALENPPLGMQIFNITTNCINYYNGYGWYETCGDCTPLPSQADAGPDQLFNDETTTTLMAANTPETGDGMWSVVSGEGGSFDDATSPIAQFIGQPCESYTLAWTITSPCGASEDLVDIVFDTPPSIADAGPDQTFNDATVSATLAANAPTIGTGIWTIESGVGGTFGDVNDPTTTFTGNPCETYSLKWAITNDCGSSEDFVEIVFNTPPTTADAGPDQTFNDAAITATLAANTPILGTGTWTIESGAGGNFADASDPTTTFTGQPCETYTLKWTIAYDCGTSEDFVDIVFNTPPTTADAGPDQTFIDVTISTALAANTPLLGAGTWSIESGTGGSFGDVNDPTTTFTGQPCETYTLKWTITNDCGTSEDFVEITFNTPPTTADAGTDQLDVQGTSTTLAGNSPVLGTGTWSILSGTGGIITEPANPVSIFSGVEGTTYILQWEIAYNCGTSSDQVTISFAGGTGNWECGQTITDSRDGQQYETVLIGDQCWMAENLNVGSLVNGSENHTDNGTIEKYCYGDDPSNCDTYGGLYQWDELMQYVTEEGVQGICPDGWYIPADEEFKMLEGAVDSQYGYPDPEWDGIYWRGSDVGGNLKEEGTAHWISPNAGATNSSGFAALPGGSRPPTGPFGNINAYGYWWSSSLETPSTAYARYLNFSQAEAYRNNFSISHGWSVRCLKSDNTPGNQPPAQPSNPVPVDGTANQPVETTLSWTCSDPENDPLTYDVYFGTENPPAQVSTGQSEATYDPGTLQYSSEYFWKIVAHDDQGNSTEGSVWSFTTEEEAVQFSCGDTFIDSRDDNTYATVQIGDQCWMAENLAFLPSVSPSSDGSDAAPYYYVFDYQGTDVAAAKATQNYQDYGVLYNWPAAQNACPEGWHTPNDAEWKILEGNADSQYPVGDPFWDQTGYRGFDANKNLKSTSGWNDNGNGTDLFGFSALPAGGRAFDTGSFYGLGSGARFWTLTEASAENGWYRILFAGTDSSYRAAWAKGLGYSIRCVYGEPLANQPPSAPHYAVPENLSIEQPVEGTILSWSSLDADNDPITYDVYFGTTETPPSVATGQSGSTFDPGTLQYETWYYWRIVAHDDQGNTTNGPLWRFQSEVEPVSFNCGEPLLDSRDGNTYATVQIGDQCWIAENLAYLPEVYPSSQGSNTDPYYYVYDYQGTSVAEAQATTNYQTYGVLYNWPASLDACPEGWHLPADADWTALTDYVSSQTEYLCNNENDYVAKALAATTNWTSASETCAVGNNLSANNSTGFSGLPGGFRNSDWDSFFAMNADVYWWSSTESTAATVWHRNMYNHFAFVSRGGNPKGDGLSVRCMRD